MSIQSEFKYEEESLWKTIKEFAPQITAFFAIIATVVGLFFLARHFSSDEVDTTVDYQQATDLVQDYNPQYGNKDAEVKVVFFKDFLCSHCADYSSITEEVINDYVDNQDVLFVYKNAYLWDNSKPIAYAAYAAHEQGKFIEFYELAFSNQAEYQAKGSLALRDWAKQIPGLDYSKWADDKESEDVIKHVEWDLLDIKNADIKATENSNGESKSVGTTPGTPTTFVFKDGEIADWWSGAVSAETLSQRIDNVVNQ